MNILSKLFSKSKDKTVVKQNMQGKQSTCGLQGCLACGSQGIQGPPGPQGLQGIPGYYSKRCDFCGIDETCNTLHECEDCNQKKPVCKHCNTSKYLDSFLDELEPDKIHHTKMRCNVCGRNEKINDILNT